MKKRNTIIIVIMLIVISLLTITVKALAQKAFVNSDEQYKVIDKTLYSEIKDAEAEENSVIIEAINNLDEEAQKDTEFQIAYRQKLLHLKDEDVKALGNVIFNEVGTSSKLDWSCVAWTVLNRVDKEETLSIKEVVSIPAQFAYKPNRVMKTEAEKNLLKECENMARDVLARWMLEKDGFEDVGRTLPNNYYSFWGDGTNTHFRTTTGVYDYWDYSLGNPYEE